MNDSKALLNAAQRTADWMVANQITDRLNANKGRGLGTYVKDTGYERLTANWETGCLCMCLLAMYRRTGKEIYLQRAELAGRYIMSLQIMDSREKRYYGAIREITPQSLEFCPRDATTAAWGLVWLYNATKNPLYLDRATLFGDWHMTYGMYEGWPLHGMIMDGAFTDRYAKGPFQSGTGLFYYDLFMASGDCRYIQNGMKPIAQNYRDYFFREDGSIIQQRDIFTNKEPPSHAGQEGVQYQMHEFNDDFGNAMLQTAADLFDDESYREKAYLYTRWLASVQDEDGGFLNGQAPSGIPIALMYFDELGARCSDDELLAAREKALKKVLSMQRAETGDAKLEGGFRGHCPETNVEGAADRSVNMRTTQYALIALLKLESDLGGFWLSRHNELFTDPLERNKEAPYRFVW